MLFLLLFVPLGFYLFLANSGLKFGNFLETIVPPSQEEESGRRGGFQPREPWHPTGLGKLGLEVPLRALNSHRTTDTPNPN